MSTRVTRKRARLEGEVDADLTLVEDTVSLSDVSPLKHDVSPEHLPKKDGEFWFDDGSIVLVASSIAFKVYKGPLVDHSPIFRDMLSLPQPAAPPLPSSNVSPPIIRLPDSAVDLRHLLRVLMPSKQIQ